MTLSAPAAESGASPATPAAGASPAARQRAARQLCEDGAPPAEALAPLLGDTLARSWQRSRQAGLAPRGRTPGAPHASAAQLARAMQRQYELLSHAQPVMDYFDPHVRSTRSMIILADAQGMVLRAQGADTFADRAQRVALRPGASWSEQHRGTNAIGTALAEGAPVVVHGGEHYLERNGFLTCAAAPILDPSGKLMGAFDISGDHRAYHPDTLPHTLALARAAAGMVEHRLFDTWHAASLRLRLHAQTAGLGQLGEGLLALRDDGLLIGANSAALDLLGMPREAIGRDRITFWLPLDVATLLDWALAHARGALAPHAVPRLTAAGGGVLWVRAEGGAAMSLRRTAMGTGPGADATPAHAPPTSAPTPAVAADPTDALASLDTGDDALAAAVQRVRRVIGKPIALLLQGESGVGKEVFARAAHASGPRRDGPFVAVNCAALPESLIEAELFGYQGGAFTGARKDGAPGRIREAEGGTLFLDEIGDMPLAMQARLLRVLQERAVVPLGGGRAVPVDFALVCATHRTLRTEMDAGRFREDLYYRLNGLTLHLPPLRQRSDLHRLVQRLLADIAPGRTLAVAPDLQQAFDAYRWPGNLRQLANALRTACALAADDEGELGWAHLPDDLAEDLRALAARPHGLADDSTAADDADPAHASDLRAQSERTVARVVGECAGNLSEAARRLGISRNTLYRKLSELGLR
ncbi:sigma-54-dependent Fis family transcriptional regulator [Ideonella sp. DXS22W]|uniref:Sigma-54-dependent Fis family transcriptional regulator n=1 Tax=Pseudaquabacterium inlustre TaxID=2984192 RepID=A0ABU9CIR3_9BURK